MFYISDRDNETRELIVTDTSDNVSERYSFKDLKQIIKSVKIAGMTDYSASICKRVKNIILAKDDYKFIIYDAVSGVEINNLDGCKIYCQRGTPFLSHISYSNETRNTIVAKLELSVKFDYEFTGLYFMKIDTNTGNIIASINEVIFVCDDNKEIKRIVKNTYGDCPDFISSKEANKLLRECGVV